MRLLTLKNCLLARRKKRMLEMHSRIAKLSYFLLLIACFNLKAEGFSQTVTLTLKNVPLKTVFDEIEKQTSFNFIYTKDLLKEAKPVTIQVTNERLEKVLSACFQDQPITYTITDQYII